MEISEKILSQETVRAWREKLRAEKKTVVVTNGCFDLLHAGHVTYLDGAKKQGDVLLVGLNADASVRELKGPERPINNEGDRAFVLAGLQSVDGVCVFPEKAATNFLKLVQPDVYVKGGDYTLETLNAEERAVLEQAGAEIAFIPLVPGKSTTALVKRFALGKKC